MKYFLFILSILTIKSTFIIAQEDANWRYIRPSNTGLPGDYVTTIASDTCDNVWAGAYVVFWEEGGVGEFDGSAWKNWTNFEGHLPSARVRDIFFDKQNHVWIGSQDGITHYDRDTTWQTWNINNSNLPDDDVYSIAADPQNNIWIIYNGGINGQGGLAKWDGTNWTIFSPTTSSLPTENVYKLAIDDQGIIWIASAMGLIKYDGLNFIRYHTGNSGISGNSIVDLKLDENGLLWILNSGGLNTFDGSNWTSHSIVVPGNDYSALDVKNGQIAIGLLASNPGVAHYDGSSWNFYPASNHLYDVHFDKSGSLWVCGIGFLGKQINGFNWQVFRRYNSGLADYFIEDIFIDSQNRKWFASGNGGHSFFNDTVWRTFGLNNNGFEPYPFPTTSVGAATAEDTSGNVWIAVTGTSEGVARWNESQNTFDIVYNGGTTGMPMQSIRTVTFDNNNRLWVGCYGLGINMFDGNQWHWINASNSNLVSDYILQLYTDNNGDVWAGTQYGAVKFVNGSTTGIFYDDTNSGLIDNYVNEIVQQPNGIYWFGTGGGVSKWDGTTWTSYTEADGIGGRVVDGLAWDENNQLLYVGAHETYNWPYYGGLSVFNGTTWTTYLQDSSPIAHKQVEDLELDQHGNLWIMTQTMGVTIYNPNGVVGLEDHNSSCPTWVFTTGLNNLSSGKIDAYAYPNPAEDKIIVEINHESNTYYHIKITDIAGRLVKEFYYDKTNKPKLTEEIDISQFKPGVYFISLINEHNQNTIKIVKK